jgi:Transposase
MISGGNRNPANAELGEAGTDTSRRDLISPPSPATTTLRQCNSATEGINLLIKKVKRVGHGFRNFNNYRLRLLLHCGVTWQTVRTARVRGRQPCFVA